MKTLKHPITHLYSWAIIFLLLMAWYTNLKAQTPNDPKYPQQTYLNTINIQGAWNVTTGDPGVRIAVIAEGGVYKNHEDLANKVTLKSTRIGYDKRPLGTQGAGIIAAETNNNKGIAGINWSAPLWSYDIGKTFNDTGYSTPFYGVDQSVVDDQINAAVSDGADILFLPFKIVPSGYIPEIESSNFRIYPSYSRPNWTDFVFGRYENLVSVFEADQYYYSQAMVAMRNAYQQGRTIVAPMDDYDGVTWGIPNRLSRDNLVIAVGSSDGIDSFQYSSEGRSNSNAEKTDIDLVAPGVDILTTTPVAPNSYQEQTNTTTAAAQATGVASLLKSADNNLTPNDIRAILRKTAVDIGDPGYDRKTGFGLMDAHAAFNFWQEHDFSRGVITDGISAKIADDEPVTLYHGPWGIEASGSYQADIYKVTFTIDLPEDTRSNIWFRAKGTLGWDHSDPNYQRQWSNVELDSINNQAIFTTYVYDLYEIGGGHIGYRPTSPSNAQVAYTIASKPGSYQIPPPEPLSGVTISGPGTIGPGQSGTWSASVNGGDPPLEYTWEYMYQGCLSTNSIQLNSIIPPGGGGCNNEGVWQYGDSDQSFTLPYNSNFQEAYIRITVTDQNNDTVTDEVRVLFGSSSAYFSIQGNEQKQQRALTKVISAEKNIPAKFKILSNYPNPFNPATNIKYGLPEAADVKLEVYNMLGRKVATLVTSSQKAGYHRVTFDAESLAGGTYLGRLIAVGVSGQNWHKTFKMNLIK